MVGDTMFENRSPQEEQSGVKSESAAEGVVATGVTPQVSTEAPQPTTSSQQATEAQAPGTLTNQLGSWEVGEQEPASSALQPSQPKAEVITLPPTEAAAAPATQTQEQATQPLSEAPSEVQAPQPTAEQPTVSPSAQVQETVARFQQAAKNPDFIPYMLETTTGTNPDGTTRSLADLSVTERVALLIVAEQQARARTQEVPAQEAPAVATSPPPETMTPPETVAPAEAAEPQQPATTESFQQDSNIDQLRAYVLSEAGSAHLYYSESYRSMDAATLVATITELTTQPDGLSPSNCTGAQLRALRETVAEQQAALDMLGTADPEVQAALQAVEQEWQKREGAVVATTATLVEVEGVGQNPEEALADVAPGATIKLNDLGEPNVVREGDQITTTLQNPDGTTTEVKAKEINVWSMVLILGLSDALLGTNNLTSLAQLWIGHNVMGPLLSKMGIDPEALQQLGQQFGGEKYSAMDGFIKMANDDRTGKGAEQITRYFEGAAQNQTAFSILEQVHPAHLKKIFAPTGTQRFGSTESGIFNLSQDNLQLSQELVDTLYAQLSDSQKQRLGIPPKQTTPQPQPQAQSQP